jgi:hypothetical protein
MFTGVSVAIALIATWIAYSTNRATVGGIAAIGWLLLGFAAYQSSSITWDAWYILFIASMCIMLAIVYEIGSSMKIWTGRQSNGESEKKEPEKKEESKINKRTTIDDRRAERGLPPIHDKDSRDRRKYGF